MKENFATALALVLKSEGGNNDDPDDHGGRTSRGIIQREYTAWRTLHGKPDADVWKATDAEIGQIYYEEYWEPQGDWLPNGIDYLFFDMKVNSGGHEATLLLQRAAGVTADGRIGPITRLAISKANPSNLITRFTEQKKIFYRTISTHPGQRKFLNGWLSRADIVEETALTMVA